MCLVGVGPESPSTVTPPLLLTTSIPTSNVYTAALIEGDVSRVSAMVGLGHTKLTPQGATCHCRSSNNSVLNMAVEKYLMQALSFNNRVAMVFKDTLSC